jgi:hypothetical protein
MLLLLTFNSWTPSLFSSRSIANLEAEPGTCMPAGCGNKAECIPQAKQRTISMRFHRGQALEIRRHQGGENLVFVVKRTTG